MPPSIAVGFWCQRSCLGAATSPLLPATLRTANVNPTLNNSVPMMLHVNNNLNRYLLT
jgi:hypothetical protein